ncbi:hypothetical protein [Deinococcus sp. 23YEL01]|uniref:hypothetical protein n=1 Tax=Deinococcus sp. 23YEL01 TaxID=2745871 RepID=UPI001E4728C4|nr:hypothetical protein [Deinococcus sp. 23YEL01]MCD0168036.1 hypothetical protein [Deinococcus sp. 23YEL01]
MYINRHLIVATIACATLIAALFALENQIGTVALAIHDQADVRAPIAGAFMLFAIILCAGRIASRAVSRVQA